MDTRKFTSGQGGTTMIIGERLRELREGKGFSQGHIEEKTGLLRCYISRVENGHTVPSVETLEKFARALEIPMFRLFYEGDVPASFTKRVASNAGKNGHQPDSPQVEQLRKMLPKISARNQSILLRTAAMMARRPDDATPKVA